MGLPRCPWGEFRCPHYDSRNCDQPSARECIYVALSGLSRVLPGTPPEVGFEPKLAVQATRENNTVPRLSGVFDLEKLRALSEREMETLRICLQGSEIPDIARSLHISPHTVRNHLKSIYRKLGAHSRGELMSRFILAEGPPRP